MLKANKGLFYSLIAHAILALAMIIEVIFYPSATLDLSRAIRVDMIDLPNKINSQALPPDPVEKQQTKLPEKKDAESEKNIEEKKPELKPIEKKPEPKPKALPEKKEKPIDESININKVKSKQKDALAKLKAASAIEKLKKEMAEEKKSEEKSKQVFKGRILSAGTALSGLDKLQSDSYLYQVDAKIKAHWALPNWLMGKSLRTRIQIKFEETGTIISKKIIQSSGNQSYDDYCLSAIEKASPLPRVPEKFSTVYKIDGVVIGFPD